MLAKEPKPYRRTRLLPSNKRATPSPPGGNRSGLGSAYSTRDLTGAAALRTVSSLNLSCAVAFRADIFPRPRCSGLCLIARPLVLRFRHTPPFNAVRANAAKHDPLHVSSLELDIRAGARGRSAVRSRVKGPVPAAVSLSDATKTAWQADAICSSNK